jgi:hypothetical protein
MIKFISHNQISGAVHLDSPDEVIQVEIKENSPVSYQLRLEQGKIKVLRDIIHIRNNIYMCKPNVPKEFLQLPHAIKARIIIYDGEDYTDTNPIPVTLNTKALEFSLMREDSYKNMVNRVTELERIVKVLSLHQRPVDLNIPNLGKPEKGMVLTALTEDVFGWSHMFKEVIKEVNKRKSLNGSIVVEASDIPYKDKSVEGAIESLQTTAVDIMKSLNDVKIALAKEIEDVAELRKTLNEYVNRDIL